MLLLRSLLVALLLLPAGSLFAVSKEEQQMQRDIAQLQSQIQQLQSAFDTQLSTLQTLATQALDAAGKANTGVSVLTATVTSTLERQLNQSLTPVAGLAAKVDNTNNDVSDLRNQVTDLNASMNKVLRTLADMNNMIKVLSAPPAAPPGGGGAPSAEVMAGNATRDQNGGNLDLAAQEWADFIKFHPDDPTVANAQFQIGEIHYTQGKLDQAAQDFQSVIDRYPDDKLGPDAFFMKGMVLKKAAQPTGAIKAFRDLVAKYPKSSQAADARDQLRAMGATAAPGRGR